MKRIIKYINYILYLIVFIIFTDAIIFKHVFGLGIFYMACDDPFTMPVPYSDYIQKRIMQGKTSFNDVNFYDTEDNTVYKVALFGGSTGIPLSEKYFQKQLEEKWGKKVSLRNFSSFSARHRQHMHLILEILPKYKPDLVIFYGGVNETMQPMWLDPRPEYPPQFYYQNETSVLKKFLIKYSSVIGALEARFKNISNYQKLYKEQKVLSPDWCKHVVDSYFETLYLSKNITETLESEHFKNTKFIAFYQPYRRDYLWPEGKKKSSYIHDEIVKRIDNIQYIHNIHNAYDDFPADIWVDECHVKLDSGANKHIIDVMTDIIAKEIPVKSNVK